MALPLDPAQQAFNAGMPLHIGRSIFRTAPSRLVVISLKPEFVFELFAQLAEHLMVVVPIVDGVAGRMNPVDGKVNMQVVSVVMHGTHPLVIAIAESFADPRLNGLQGGVIDLLASPKAHDQVINW